MALCWSCVVCLSLRRFNKLSFYCTLERWEIQTLFWICSTFTTSHPAYLPSVCPTFNLHPWPRAPESSCHCRAAATCWQGIVQRCRLYIKTARGDHPLKVEAKRLNCPLVVASVRKRLYIRSQTMTPPAQLGLAAGILALISFSEGSEDLKDLHHVEPDCDPAVSFVVF